MYIGCLPVLLIAVLLLGFALVEKGLRLVVRFVQTIGDIALWLWGSVCNLLLPAHRQRRVYNPWSGTWNMEEPVPVPPDDSGATPGTHAKLYADDDGEYIEYEDLR